jgi:hypothetical protein
LRKPSLASTDVQSYSGGQLKWVIDNGICRLECQVPKEFLSDEEIWSIVVFLRRLPQAGSLGGPGLYSH